MQDFFFCSIEAFFSYKLRNYIHVIFLADAQKHSDATVVLFQKITETEMSGDLWAGKFLYKINIVWFKNF